MVSGPIWLDKFEIKPGRWVYVPSEESRVFGSKLHNFILKKWSPPSYFYHLQDGGHISAINDHLHNEFFCIIDIKNFFGCVSRSQVTRALKRLSASYGDAREITLRSTVRNSESRTGFCLPYGFVQSPVLASLVFDFSDAGNALSEIVVDDRMTVSLYMDDLIISSNDFDLLSHTYEQLKDRLDQNGFEPSVKSQPPSKNITVFNIEVSKRIAEITEERMKKFDDQLADATPASAEAIDRYISTVKSLPF